MANDEGGLATYLLCGIKSLANLCYVVSINAEHFPTQGTVLGGGILVGYHAGLGGELDVVCIIEHYEIVQSQCAGNTCCTLRDFLLNATVGNVCIDGLLLEGGVAGACIKALGCNSSTNGIGVPLT